MEKIREVFYNSDTNKIFLKGFLGKVLFEIEPVGDFISFEETFFLKRKIVYILRSGRKNEDYKFLITQKAKSRLLEMLEPTSIFNYLRVGQYYTAATGINLNKN